MATTLNDIRDLISQYKDASGETPNHIYMDTMCYMDLLVYVEEKQLTSILGMTITVSDLILHTHVLKKETSIRIDKVGDIACLTSTGLIEAVQVHNFKPGDVLLVKLKEDCMPPSQASMNELEEVVKQALPDNTKFIITHSVDFEVIRETEEDHF